MIETLKNIVGEQHLSATEADLTAYSYDASGMEAEPALICWPTDAEQIRKIILYCNRTNTPLMIRGLGTNTVGSTIGENAIILDLTRMNRLYKEELKEKYLELEPGIILKSLNSYLRRQGYELPIAPYTGDFCTLGGMISQNALGARSYTLGRMKDWILSLEYLDGTGKYYHLTKDFERIVGWEGTTGIIIRAKILVTERIMRTSADLISFTGITALCQKLREVKKEPDVLAIDYLDRTCSAFLGIECSPHLLVEYYSDRGRIKEAEPLLRTLKRREAAHDMLRLKGYWHLEDPQIRAERLQEFLEWLERKEIPSFGPLGMNIIFSMFRQDEQDKRRNYYDQITTLNSVHASVLGWGNRKKYLADLGTKHALITLKEEYDYNNILNRGKIIDFR
ncbi:MAG: FAD-binding oxidoreductase [Nanoarchaeota archaeon]